MLKIYGLEISHKTAPIEVREKFSLSEEEVENILKFLKNVGFSNEIYIISTCNRFGIFSDCENLYDILKRILEFKKSPNTDNYINYFKFYENESLIRHIFRLSAGLESQILGEHQILGQMKTFYNLSLRFGFIRQSFGELLRRSFKFGKFVRTNLYNKNLSFGFLIGEIIKKFDFEKPNILVIGTGEMAFEIFNNLKRVKFNKIFVASREFDRAINMAKFFENDNIIPISYNQINEILNDMNFVISASNVGSYIVNLNSVKNEKIVFVDLCVPRTIDPKIGNRYRLYNLDDLNAFLKNRSLEDNFLLAETLVEGEVKKFIRWLREKRSYSFIKNIKFYIDDLNLKYEKNKILSKVLHNVFSKMKEIARDVDNPEIFLSTIESAILNKPLNVLKRRKQITIGSRGSLLALSQTREIINKLKEIYPDIDFVIKIIKTSGDVGENVRGAFVKEIREELLNKEIDIAVHSLKDVPPDEVEGLVFGAIPKRADPRDVMISYNNVSFGELPYGAVVGTSSPRRKIQLLEIRKDLEIIPIKGNIDTRIKKLKNGEVDALILAKAGIDRIGLSFLITEIFDVETIIPAPGQGALVLEIRKDDEFVLNLIKPLDDFETRICVIAERTFMKEVGGDCKFPIGAYAYIKDGQFFIIGMLSNPYLKKLKLTGDVVNSENISKELAYRLLNGKGSYCSSL